jgi:hypothetical protein
MYPTQHNNKKVFKIKFPMGRGVPESMDSVVSMVTHITTDFPNTLVPMPCNSPLLFSPPEFQLFMFQMS